MLCFVLKSFFSFLVSFTVIKHARFNACFSSMTWVIFTSGFDYYGFLGVCALKLWYWRTQFLHWFPFISVPSLAYCYLPRHAYHLYPGNDQKCISFTFWCFATYCCIFVHHLSLGFHLFCALFCISRPYHSSCPVSNSHLLSALRYTLLTVLIRG